MKYKINELHGKGTSDTPAKKPFDFQEAADSLNKKQSECRDQEIARAANTVHSLRQPRMKIEGGTSEGHWVNDRFIFEDSHIPLKYNPDKLTVAQIRERVKAEFGIDYNGVQFKNRQADFSDVSVAHISTQDIVLRAAGLSEEAYNALGPHERAETLNKVFGSRNSRSKNFDLAFTIIAERQDPIPGLSPGYTKEELKAWANKKCSWDEQLHTGYNLVPNIIHLNVPHTGSVSITRNAARVLDECRRRENPEEEMRRRDHLQKYALHEEDAPISYQELTFYVSNKAIKANRKRKGDRTMPKMKGHSLDRHVVDKKSDSLDTIKITTQDELDKQNTLFELGKKFVADKEKLDAVAGRIKNSNISEIDKSKFLSEVAHSFQEIEEEYHEKVVELQERSEKRAQQLLQEVQEKKDELAAEKADIDAIAFDEATAKLDKASAAADRKINEAEGIKSKYTKMLEEQMRMSENQRKAMQANSLKNQ